MIFVILRSIFRSLEFVEFIELLFCDAAVFVPVCFDHEGVHVAVEV